MLNILKKFIYLVLLIVIWYLSINFSFWKDIKNPQYISLHPLSSTYDVKKFQKFFKALKIYKWNIDWEFENIKPYITNFQIKNNIIQNEDNDWAGYIWPKSYSFFEKKYGNDFKKVYDKFFKIDTPTDNEEKYFIVSAYYSPLPGQKRYSTWDYKRDIRLNWNWTHGASWEAVHPGFIAAPSNYPFGTKIELEWLWIWVVEDRGWAIVRKGVRWYDADRLDIWMWYWDEWLERALKWWKRKVKWKILNKNTKITISFPTEYKEYLAKKINPESSKEDIKSMQELFKKALMYSWKIDWKYSNFKESIVNFQVKHKIIKNKNDGSAGYIWPKTIKKLEEKYDKVFILTRREDLEKNKQKWKITEYNKENKTWTIPKKTTINQDNKIIIKSSITDKILEKYKISNNEKTQIEKISKKLNEQIKIKFKNNNLKRKSEINKIRKKVEKVIEKLKEWKTKYKLVYLKDILKEMSN